jgi:hypothetical protein
MRQRIIVRSMWTTTLVVLASCRPMSSPSYPLGAEQAHEGETFQLAIGASHQLADGTRITFPQVIAESRCPVDVVCVWEGEAEIRVGLEPPTGDELTTHVKISGGGRADSTKAPPVTAGEYEIQLLQLDPYPDTHQQQDSKQWVAHLRVKRL